MIRGMFRTAISAAAATKRGESRQTPRDRRAYPYRDRGRQFIFQLERGLFGKAREWALLSIAILRIARLVDTETNRAYTTCACFCSFALLQQQQQEHG